MGSNKKPFSSFKHPSNTAKTSKNKSLSPGGSAGGTGHKRALPAAVNTVLLFFLLLAVVTACYAGSAYHLPAGDSRAVELTVRYSDVQIFAARAGLTVEEALLFLKERGVTSVGVAEYTLWQLRKEPGFYVLSSLELAGELALNPELSPYRDFLETKAREAGFSFGDYLVFMPDGPWAEQVGEHLRTLYALEGEDLFRLTTHHQGEMVLYLLQGVSYDHLPHLSLGAKPAQLEQVAAAGLLINPYLSPRTIETPATAEQMLAAYERYPLSAAVFEGGVVPGYPDTLLELAAALRAREIPAVLYEYHRFPKGMQELAPLLDYALVVMRDGSINDDPRAAINGLRERRVQLLELELRGLASRSTGAELQEKISTRLTRLTAALQENGYTLGQAALVRPFQGHSLLYVIMAAGILSLALFLLQFFLPLQPASLLGLFALGLAALAFLFHTRFLFTQQALALLAAVLFPFYGALYLLTWPFAAGASGLAGEAGPTGSTDPTDPTGSICPTGLTPPRRRKAIAGRASLDAGLLRYCLARVFILFLFSLAGGLLVHGLLTTPPFFHGLELFRGVKAMYILPLALSGLTALVLLAGFSRNLPGTAAQAQAADGSPPRPQDRKQSSAPQPHSREQGLASLAQNPKGSGRIKTGAISYARIPAYKSSPFPLQFPVEQRQAFFASLRRLLRRPLTLGDLLLLGLLLFGAYIYLTRTGHVRTIIPLESTLRNTLEQVFGARPRFKEFALGYPLALVGLYLSAGFSGGVKGDRGKARRCLAFGALFGGVLVPISVVNTFAHTLAPLSLSLLRSCHGFWLGIIAGLLLLYLGKKIVCFFSRR